MPAFANPSGPLGAPPAPAFAMNAFAPQYPFDRSLWDQLYNDNPQAAVARWLRQTAGPQAFSPFEQFARDQSSRLYQNWLADLPELGVDSTFLGYLQNQGPSLKSQFQGLTPRQRGENPA